MGSNGGDGDIWICELDGPRQVWYWLCRPCVFELRAERNAVGAVVWTKVRPKRKVDGPCSRCALREQEKLEDPLAFERSRRAAVWSPGLSRRIEDGKIIERIVGG